MFPVINKMKINTFNTIIYCDKWDETLNFYANTLGLTVGFSTSWFVEFIIGTDARLSIADQKRSRFSSAHGMGLTLSLEVTSIDDAHNHMIQKGLNPSPVTEHPWNARVFYIHDPEGNRIEFWMPVQTP